MKTKSITIKKKDMLGGKPKQRNHPNYTKALAIKTVDEETIKVKNPINGNEALVTLSRTGTTDEKLAMVLLSPDATKDQKNSFISNWLFERGKENASFIAELYLSKGAHVKETQAFKRQIRWDFEMFANILTNKLTLLSKEMKTLKDRYTDPFDAFDYIGSKFADIAEVLNTQRERITNARMREKGFGVYLDRNGQAFSIEDDEIVDIIKGDKEQFENEKNT